MLFTEGKHRKYERMMRETPRAPGRSKSEAMLFKERDCPHCLYYSNKEGKCSLEKCVLIERGYFLMVPGASCACWSAFRLR